MILFRFQIITASYERSLNLIRILCINGNVAPKLALSLLDSKSLMETQKTVKIKIQYLHNHIFNKTYTDVASIQRIGRKRNDQQTRPILIKFRYIKDAFLSYLHDNKGKREEYYRTNVDGKYVKDTDIGRLHHKYCK